ncbi:MAG: hypothetical protein JNK25_02335 [Phycisphaerae bacterium]|nr:hypothetical protein [Phycisphaerae bacterium]
MRITLSLVLFLSAGGSVALADGPKAYVMTGWNTSPGDKADHEKIAAEAKKDLENAGYKVTLIHEASKQQVKDAIQDPDARAMVLIDHGTKGRARVRCKDNNGVAERVTAEQFGGPYNNMKAVTIHACDQDQQAWKDLFPNADFHSWTGDVYCVDELEWQKNKTYRRANEPQAGQSQGEVDEDLTHGQFPEAADGTTAPLHGLSGNWPMDPALGAMFGTQIYNVFVMDNDPTSNDLLFSAVVMDGQILSYKLAAQSGPPTFQVFMPHDVWVQARLNPWMLMQPDVLGGLVQVQPLRTSVPPQVLFAGFARNVFRVPYEVVPPCIADYNADGGVDGGDVEAFFSDWEQGFAAADVNGDGGVDGADVETFFAAWESGAC